MTGRERRHRLPVIPVIVLLAIFAGGSLSSCGKKGPTRVDEVDRLINEGWQLFASEQYTEALAKFDDALLELSQHPDALHGRGWSLAYLEQFNDARIAFVNAKELSFDNPDIWAGGAFVYSALGDQDQVVYWAEIALGTQAEITGAGQWVFSKNDAITHIHLRLVLAKAYWVRGSYVQCGEQLDIIESGVSHGGSAQLLLDDLSRLTALNGSPF
ncbi:tetratricopeptide repeat protein [Candidatus Zixiibacteriota bacterium]